MIRALQNMPLLLQFTAIAGVAMLLPSIYALRLEEFHIARSFLYSGVLTLFVTSLIAVAVRAEKDDEVRLQRYLFALFAAYTILPIALAFPFYEALGTTSFLNAYLEMVSCLTTTGFVLFEDPGRLSPALHLWRAIVGWMGGLMMWVAAVAVFSPLSLGGYEVSARSDFDQFNEHGQRLGRLDAGRRWRRTALHLVPVYVGLTLVLWILLMVIGERSLTAMTHAMSVMATSGISNVGGIQEASTGLAGEILVFLFLFFALSRKTFATELGATRREKLFDDPEFRFAIFLVLVVPTLLLLRHWFGAIDVDEEFNLTAAFKAAWGSIFTVLSFLSTTGFESADWQTAQNWSGLSTPGLILLGLSMIGGGVATTAGGVKLLRVYALYLQGLREMERLVHPSSVSASGSKTRRIRRQGALIAWVFFMLFALSMAAVTLMLTGLGIGFQDGLVLAISALSTTGPLAQAAVQSPIEILSEAAGVKIVLCAAMVLGRLETLAIIALLSPNLWRN
ncbi:TrkH family potassium uptake protein [Cognatishimia activa]|uniref:TrkH family potassium uptake protein n=1 Tax=Cognatishimia activa TaxID=1715691 RepID=UPI0022305A95|nr:potassium transporter TrkG [Cognatishimia activa]UZD91987.1 TrkH family potassium uptake protein [Cognatishimia activa]